LKEAKEPDVKCWWDEFSDKEILALDTEQVTKPKYDSSKVYSQHIATVDIVNTKLERVYSAKVHHPPGSFKDHQIFQMLTGFNKSSFADPNLPSEEKVKKEVAALLKGKLVVTIGGESDYRALGIEMGDPEYKLFDLQSHFFVEKKNERDVGIREGHSLRSLAKYYLNKTQEKLHTSLEDAKMTMELFEIYKKVKVKDDGNNLQQKFNKIYPYNFIPVVPNPLKDLLKK
jgi:hypothetical protein